MFGGVAEYCMSEGERAGGVMEGLRLTICAGDVPGEEPQKTQILIFGASDGLALSSFETVPFVAGFSFERP